MCAGLESLEPFEDFEDLFNLEAFCFFVLLDGGFFLLKFSGLVGSWDREAGLEGGLEGALEDGWDEG